MLPLLTVDELLFLVDELLLLTAGCSVLVVDELRVEVPVPLSLLLLRDDEVSEELLTVPLLRDDDSDELLLTVPLLRLEDVPLELLSTDVPRVVPLLLDVPEEVELLSEERDTDDEERLVPLERFVPELLETSGR